MGLVPCHGRRADTDSVNGYNEATRLMLSPRKLATRLVNRRSRNGQSIILVAFAFIALVAFVGIATDVALLFVRYSTLRRAVDAAAIAAAGQVRENATFL